MRLRTLLSDKMGGNPLSGRPPPTARQRLRREAAPESRCRNRRDATRASAPFNIAPAAARPHDRPRPCPGNSVDLGAFLVQGSKGNLGFAVNERGFGPNPVDAQVGNNVGAKRTEAGLSQDYVANQLGLSLPEYQEYESGGRRFGAERLLRLARLFGVSPEEFFEGLSGAAPRELFH